MILLKRYLDYCVTGTTNNHESTKSFISTCTLFEQLYGDRIREALCEINDITDLLPDFVDEHFNFGRFVCFCVTCKTLFEKQNYCDFMNKLFVLESNENWYIIEEYIHLPSTVQPECATLM